MFEVTALLKQFILNEVHTTSSLFNVPVPLVAKQFQIKMLQPACGTASNSSFVYVWRMSPPDILQVILLRNTVLSNLISISLTFGWKTFVQKSFCLALHVLFGRQPQATAIQTRECLQWSSSFQFMMPWWVHTIQSSFHSANLFGLFRLWLTCVPFEPMVL